ncbi:virulence associated lipoprotein [Borrelia hispanica]|uniref:virulence associated lipoprotein n=1 Tax=Borrelia hispanica TaxID=40835 RepID=UPI00046555B8|nr:virulence associated lipoprotein [Borrelia hispanica]
MLMNLLLVACGPKKYDPIGSIVKNPNGICTDSVVDGAKSQEGDSPLNNDIVDEETLEQKMQKEIADIKSKIPIEVTKILKFHDGTIIWNENYRSFIGPLRWRNIIDDSIGRLYFMGAPNGLFLRLRYNNGVENVPYKDLALRKEFYLALEYNDDIMKPFIYIYEILAFRVRASYSSPLPFVDLDSEINKLKNRVTEKARNYARAYYINVYKALQYKKEKLDTLFLKDIRFLKTKLQELELAKTELRTEIIQKFVDDYNRNEVINSETNNTLKSVDATVDELASYFETRFKDFYAKCDAVITLADEIKVVLDRIQ